jgi:RNA polymerase sigma-70 factor (ECF subfamily)
MAGDTAALGSIYDAHGTALYSVALRLMGDPASAEDLTHDVFVEAWQSLSSYSAARGSLRTWLMVRLRSRALDRKKSAAYRLAMRSTSDEATVDAAVTAGGAAESGQTSAPASSRFYVRQAMHKLTDDQRSLVELLYFEGLSLAEIAERNQLPLGTVKSRIARALDQMKSVLSQEAVS